jgi:hypothetical protein
MELNQSETFSHWETMEKDSCQDRIGGGNCRDVRKKHRQNRLKDR